jgi:GNAT superfamily N-acetyltransferase
LKQCRGGRVLVLRSANNSDLDILTQMNRELVEDEGSQNPMKYEELKNRMMNWLMTDWNIDLLTSNDTVVGYALYQYRNNQYNEAEKEVYLRQFFIMRESRNKGYGQLGIELLRERRFNEVKTIIIDVLETNPKGINFWRKCGFLPYSATMKLDQK